MDVNFRNEIIKFLEIELKSLSSKLEHIRRNSNDFGTYKNLVLAFKEILRLYQDMTEIKTGLKRWDGSVWVSCDDYSYELESKNTTVDGIKLNEYIDKFINEDIKKKGI